MGSKISQQTTVGKNSKVEIESNYLYQELTIYSKRSGKKLVLHIGRRNGITKVFKTKQEALLFAGLIS